MPTSLLLLLAEAQESAKPQEPSWAPLLMWIPLGLLAYLVYVLRRFAGFNWLLALAGLVIFVVSLRYAATIQCRQEDLLPVTAASTSRCLNGTMAYMPAFIALAIASAWLAVQRHPASFETQSRLRN